MGPTSMLTHVGTNCFWSTFCSVNAVKMNVTFLSRSYATELHRDRVHHREALARQRSSKEVLHFRVFPRVDEDVGDGGQRAAQADGDAQVAREERRVAAVLEDAVEDVGHAPEDEVGDEDGAHRHEECPLRGGLSEGGAALMDEQEQTSVHVWGVFTNSALYHLLLENPRCP
uniref:Uncharacterized protein n=1 Tax=Steinernema glaseri TaxID=37863 RepID=A0A1I7ZVE7_9BILA